MAALPASRRLLTADDPDPVEFEPAQDRRSPFLLVCDHAGRRIPKALGDLGLAEVALERHIAYDIGAAGLSRRLGALLGADLIRQTYSRLVVDCNRDPSRPDAMVRVSDGTVVPGNQSLDEQGARARIDEIHRPYHDRIALEISRRLDEGRNVALVLVHSFTPVMAGFRRPWHAGVLHLGDSPLALRTLELLRTRTDMTVGDNEPYAMDGTDFTAPFHAIARGLPYVELEIRQDLIGDEAGQQRIAALLAPLIAEAGVELGLA